MQLRYFQIYHIIYAHYNLSLSTLPIKQYGTHHDPIVRYRNRQFGFQEQLQVYRECFAFNNIVNLMCFLCESVLNSWQIFGTDRGMYVNNIVYILTKMLYNSKAVAL